MFSLQQTDDLVDHDHPCLISFQQQNQKPVDLGDHVASRVDHSKGKTTSINYPVRKRAGSRGESSNKPGLIAGGGDGEEEEEKKMFHREMERQRRQEMAKLYASLRDLLPLQFIKGTRSISDHMHQAVQYITQMEENIKALGMKRDQLLKNSFSSNTNENYSTNNLPNTVTVSLCNEGVEVLINSCLIEDGFTLSGVLNTLVEEGYSITSCILTKVNDRLLHSIQIEASDPALPDASVLQQRLVLLANTSDQPNFS